MAQLGKAFSKLTKAVTGRSEYRTMSESSETDADLMYTPKISSPGNYRRFLDLAGAGSLSDDEAGYHSGSEGFIDDELVPEESPLPEEGGAQSESLAVSCSCF